MLRQRGLALGGSLDNAIVLGETGVLNNALRFDDEFVRHKILDVIGDLSLVGYPVIGHLVAHRGGHALHTAFAARILEETDAWRLVEAPEGAVLPVGRAERGAGVGAAGELARPPNPKLEIPRSQSAESAGCSRACGSVQREGSWARASGGFDRSDHHQRLRRRRRPARLEPVDPLTDQIELQRVAAGL